MDLTGEATVERFKIGPTSTIGRTIAFRVLLSGSTKRLRKKILLFLSTTYRKLRFAILTILPWFQPSRNTQGILITVSVMAFLLKRFTKVRSRAETAYRRKFWRNVMEEAVTYEEWAHAAKMLEKREPPLAPTNDFDLYDVELVRNKLEELRQRRRRQRDGGGSLRDIVFSMRADLLRNLGNMCNPQLHVGRIQVPRLIKEYMDEVSMQLRMVCDSDSDDLLLEEKLSFMHETRHAFGRTALLLSGGASLGAFHVGVVRTLVENRLLPRIVAGSSVGSIICAIVGTRSWPELESFFEDDIHTLQFFDQLGGLLTVVRRIMTHGAVHDIRHLQRLLRHLTNNLTFQEAFDMTGRILGITVCSPRKHEPPRCLNYLTSPHVVIWSAVTASCAFPGLFEAQELMAKNRGGELVPFHAPFQVGVGESQSHGASTRRWRDGSLEIDLPMMQLKELFNVNHFIVSQANPHIAPLLRLKKLVRSYGGEFAAKLAHLTEMEVKHRCNQILELGFPLGGVAKLFAQEWEGDVTVVMPATLSQYSKIIQNPSHPEIQKAIDQGRRCTWEKLSAVKANCAIELVLDECVAILNRMRRLKRSAERAAGLQGSSTNVVRFTTSGSRRIPSWNCIARENSTGSLEDEILSDATADHHQPNNGEGVMSNRCDVHGHRTAYDSSDSESDTAELHCWTRAGGPLMRTPSANKFINFVQNLNIESELTPSHGDDKIENHGDCADGYAIQFGNRYPGGINSRSQSSDANLDGELVNQVQVTCGSIVVSDGDLLQPERGEHGIVINVVKREDFNGVSGSDNCEDECAHSENVVAAETLQINSFNASASSDSDEDGYPQVNRNEDSCLD